MSSTDNDGGSIPNLISLSQIPSNMLQEIETDLLEPVVFNQGSTSQDGFIRWTLQNKGFLHSHSKIFMSVSVTGSIEDGYFNPVTGLGQLIKKAVLKVGNKTLNEVSSWDGLYAAKSTLIKSENNLEREQFTTGRFMNTGFRYNAGSDVLSSAIGLDNGLEYDDGSNELTVPLFAKIDGTANANNPTFAIDLSDLFPFLKVNQLPLYMINEPVNIELTTYPTNGYRVQISSGDTADQPVTIDRASVKFCADYVFYGSSDQMSRFAQANQDMSFSFVDYRLVETSVTDTSLGNGIIRNLGMANRVVPRIITSIADTGQGETTILSYAGHAFAPELAGGIPGTIKYNVRYNDRFEFTSDVDNTARLFSILSDSEGVPFIPRSLYSAQKDSIITDTLEGRIQNDNLLGKLFYLGTRLTNGRVGNRGLEVHLTGSFPSSVDVMRNYCEYLRVCSLKNGMFDVFNA